MKWGGEKRERRRGEMGRGEEGEMERRGEMK